MRWVDNANAVSGGIWVLNIHVCDRGLPLITYAPRGSGGGGGSILLYISIA